MLPAQLESCLLRDAVKTMMAQICKVGVTYTNDLLIEGTVVVTVDRQKVIVIHFDDRLSSQQPTPVTHVSSNDAVTVSSASSSDANANALAEGFRSAISELAGRHLSVSGVANQLSKPGWFVGSTSSKMMTCLNELNETLNERIAIDVDSEDGNEAFNDIDLCDVTNCGGNVPSSLPADHPAFPSASSSGKTCRKVKDAKHVIVIEDTDLLEPACDVPESADSELKLLDSFASRYLLPSNDLETVTDTNDSTKSLLNRGQQDFNSAMLRCEICGWQARSNSQLESHLVIRHGIIDSRRLGRRIAHIACSLCGKRFRFRAQLDKHRLRHSSVSAERLHRCHKCRNTYTNAQSLSLHSQVHDRNFTLGVTRLNCLVCKKTYANKVLFQKHIMYMHERTECSHDS